MNTRTPPSAQSAKAALDAWTREMVAWHFSPATGCDYWLKWAETAGWDPIKEIKSFEDMARFAAARPGDREAGGGTDA